MSVLKDNLANETSANELQPTSRELVSTPQVSSQANQAFTKADRLLRPREFRQVYERGQQRLHSSLFMIFALRTDLPRVRLGITTSRKIGKAVKRNRCRRLLREVFRRHKIELPTGWDLVVNVKHPLTQTSFAVAESEFLRLTKKLWKS